MGARPGHFVYSQQGPLRLYSTAELLAMPPPEWLVENVIPEGGLVGLYAPPESLKSFVSIDLSLCVATGLPWHGHQVQKGFVVYISAEGGGGIGKRILAWLVEHESEAHNADIAW